MRDIGKRMTANFFLGINRLEEKLLYTAEYDFIIPRDGLIIIDDTVYKIMRRFFIADKNEVNYHLRKDGDNLI